MGGQSLFRKRFSREIRINLCQNPVKFRGNSLHIHIKFEYHWKLFPPLVNRRRKGSVECRQFVHSREFGDCGKGVLCFCKSYATYTLPYPAHDGRMEGRKGCWNLDWWIGPWSQNHMMTDTVADRLGKLDVKSSASSASAFFRVFLPCCERGQYNRGLISCPSSSSEKT